MADHTSAMTFPVSFFFSTGSDVTTKQSYFDGNAIEMSNEDDSYDFDFAKTNSAVLRHRPNDTYDEFEDNADFSILSLMSSLNISDQDLHNDELSDRMRSMFIISYTAVIILALLGNLSVVAVVSLNVKLRTVTNMFLVSLAVSDLLIVSLNMPLQLRYYISNEWKDGEFACKMASYVQGVVVVSSILTLTGIALDRYYAIIHPLRARHIHTVRRALVLISIFWLTSLVLVIPQLFLQRLDPKLKFPASDDRRDDDDDDEGDASELEQFRVQVVYVCVEFIPKKEFRVAYTMFFYIVLYLLPVAIMIFTYGRIVHRLWNRRPIGETPSTVLSTSGSVRRMTSSSTSVTSPVLPPSPSTDAFRRRLTEKKRIVRMLVVVVAMFTLGWFPFFTIHVYQLFSEHDENQLRLVTAMLQLIGYGNSCVNPILYCLLNDSFQQHLYRTVVRLLCCSTVCRQVAANSAGNGLGARHFDASCRRRVTEGSGLMTSAAVGGGSRTESHVNTGNVNIPSTDARTMMSVIALIAIRRSLSSSALAPTVEKPAYSSNSVVAISKEVGCS